MAAIGREDDLPSAIIANAKGIENVAGVDVADGKPTG
jgi:hypothetical protein